MHMYFTSILFVMSSCVLGANAFLHHLHVFRVFVKSFISMTDDDDDSNYSFYKITANNKNKNKN